MKKYFVLILLFFLFVFVNFKDSYGYVDCGNDVIYPQGINTLNLRDYINSLSYREIKRICSYDCCYNLQSGNVVDIVRDFNSYCYSELSEEDKLIVAARGLSVTSVYLDKCN